MAKPNALKYFVLDIGNKYSGSNASFRANCTHERRRGEKNYLVRLILRRVQSLETENTLLALRQSEGAHAVTLVHFFPFIRLQELSNFLYRPFEEDSSNVI